jgi:hypothetical protein
MKAVSLLTLPKIRRDFARDIPSIKKIEYRINYRVK